MSVSDKTNKIIDDLSYFLGSESVQIINGLHQVLTDTLVLVVQQNEIINGDEITNLETQANTIEHLTRERDELEQDKAELLEAFLISRQQITKACNNAVEKLRELAPDMGWDDGQSTADMYLSVTDPVLAKHSGEDYE